MLPRRRSMERRRRRRRRRRRILLGLGRSSITADVVVADLAGQQWSPQPAGSTPPEGPGTPLEHVLLRAQQEDADPDDGRLHNQHVRGDAVAPLAEKLLVSGA